MAESGMLLNGLTLDQQIASAERHLKALQLLKKKMMDQAKKSLNPDLPDKIEAKLVDRNLVIQSTKTNPIGTTHQVHTYDMWALQQIEESAMDDGHLPVDFNVNNLHSFFTINE